MDPQSKRMYACYKSLRREFRTRRLSASEKDTPGSFFNHIVLQVAERFAVPMEQVREAIVLGYADAHSITIEEARDWFDVLKAQREWSHERQHCTVDGLFMARACSAAS